VGEQPTGGATGGPSITGGPSTSVVTVATAALALGVVLGGLAGILSSDDDDRPVIVVRNGTTIFDGGDSQDQFKRWKDWDMDSNDGKEWKPLHPNGASVKSFSVVMRGYDTTSPAECGNILSTQAVVISVSNGQVTETLRVNNRLHLRLSPRLVKYEPVIIAPSAMTAAPRTPTAPGTLTYPNIGSISSVNVNNTTCTFPSASPAREAVRVYVHPER
jgi:hypothetical protein